MRVNFYATLRPIVGGKAVELCVAEGGLSVRQLIEGLVARFPRLHAELFDDQGQLYRHVHVLINGRDVVYLAAGLETMVSTEDTVNIFPAVAGGASSGSMASVPPTQFEQAITGLPGWRLQEYLLELGAAVTVDGWLRGAGWRARLTPLDDYVIGALRVGRVRLELRGEPQAVAAVRRALAPKLLRAGG